MLQSSGLELGLVETFISVLVRYRDHKYSVTHNH